MMTNSDVMVLLGMVNVMIALTINGIRTTGSISLVVVLAIYSKSEITPIPRDIIRISTIEN